MPCLPEDDYLIESEYHRERKLRSPIGQPSHCEQLPKTNRTASDASQSLCPSFCAVSSGHETGKVNQVSEMPEAPENIPENVEIIETSTAFKSQKITTTKLLPIERKSDSVEPSTTLSDNLNHTSIEHTTVKDKIDTSSQGPLPIDDKNKVAIQAEEPVEVRDSPILSQNTPAPVVQSNYSEKIEPIPNERVDEIQKKQNKPKELDTNTEIKQQEIESFADAQSGSIKENDIKPTFKKVENKFEKLAEDGGVVVDVPKPANGNIEPLTPITSSTQTTTVAPAFGVPLETANPACLLIYMQIRSESFNLTLGSDEICRNFNITYNIPLSKYMKENRFELVFL